MASGFNVPCLTLDECTQTAIGSYTRAPQKLPSNRAGVSAEPDLTRPCECQADNKKGRPLKACLVKDS
jgi:hypothetical protein